MKDHTVEKCAKSETRGWCCALWVIAPQYHALFARTPCAENARKFSSSRYFEENQKVPAKDLLQISILVQALKEELIAEWNRSREWK